jgi:hypothetical protein
MAIIRPRNYFFPIKSPKLNFLIDRICRLFSVAQILKSVLGPIKPALTSPNNHLKLLKLFFPKISQKKLKPYSNRFFCQLKLRMKKRLANRFKIKTERKSRFVVLHPLNYTRGKKSIQKCSNFVSTHRKRSHSFLLSVKL